MVADISSVVVSRGCGRPGIAPTQILCTCMGFTGFPLRSPADIILLDRCGFGAGFHCRPADGQSWLWFGGGFHCWPADRQSLLCSLVVGQSL